MSMSRRGFCHLIGASLTLHDGSLPEWDASTNRDPETGASPIRLDNNENPYGPFPAARAAVAKAIDEGGRYPSAELLVEAVAKANGVRPANVLLTVGATEGLALSAYTFSGATAPLVTAAPSYGAIASAAERLGHPVIRVPLSSDGKIDLEAMERRAAGAGLVYICNPNNPTGTIVSATDLRGFLARLGSASPSTAIVIGEAYHEYIADSSYATAVPEAIRRPGILVNRTFSKLYGLAGMRLGYLIAHEETIKRVSPYRVPLGANGFAIAAASAALADEPERVRQRDLNEVGRKAAERFFRERGWEVYDGRANFVFVNVKRDIAAFRSACQANGLLIGRPYPPAISWARFTIGTPGEMSRAFSILERLL